MVPAQSRNRRDFLYTVGTSAALTSLSGCLFGAGGGCGHGLFFNMQGPLTDTDIARRESRAVDDLNPVAQRLVRTAIENGAATYATPKDPPIEAGAVTRIENRYMTIAVEKQENKTTVTGYEYEIKTNDSIRKSATSEETIDVSELPTHDQATFVAAFGGKAKGIRDQKVEGAELSMLVAYADKTHRRNSVFVPEPKYQYVQYGETVFRVRLTETREVTVETYRISLQKEAESTQEYAEQIRTNRGRHVDPASLSEDARTFVRKGMKEDGTSTCYPLPDHVQTVLEKFGLSGETDSQYVDYGGQWYDASVSEYHSD